MARLSRFFEKLGPLGPALAFYVVALALFSVNRLVLALVYSERLAAVEHGWWVFPLGVRMDTILLCMMLALVVPLMLLLPQRLGRLWKPGIALYFTLALMAFVFLEAATYAFAAEYDTRPNRLFVEFLKYPREVFGLLWSEYKLDLVVGLVLVGVIGWFGWRASNHLLERHRHWAYWKRLLVLPLVVFILFAGARSSLAHRPANPSTAAFSSDHLVNELALNSSYSLAYAVYRMGDEAGQQALYGTMPREEILARVRRNAFGSGAGPQDPELPTLHHQRPRAQVERPYNLVVILEESLGAEYVGALGGKPLTPNLDRLSREGLFLSNLYATGTRTVRGIEAVIAGFLPTAGRSVVKLGLSQNGFFTVADLLRRRGYGTEFIYGGESHFDDMAAFFLGNGFERVTDEYDFKNPAFHGVWGVSDEDLMRKAHERFVSYGDKPFFALMLSTSNHTPFDFPKGRIELYEQPPSTVNNAIKYADYAIGEFFRLAQQADYYDHTIFLVVADHNTRTWGDQLVPIDKFHIPGLILGPNVPKRRDDRLASQVDLMPTLLSLMGIESDHPMVGRDLLSLPADDPGRAIMQFYRVNAYRVGDQVVVHQPDKPARQFRYAHGRLEPTAKDPELVRDALAHVLLPGLLYAEQRYRLPEATGGPGQHIAAHAP